jgi:hypothetical protein
MPIRARGDETLLWLCGGAAAVLVGVDLVYLATANPASGTRETAVSLSLGVAAALLVGGALAPDGAVAALLIASGAFLAFAWAVLGALSIGILIAPAAVLGFVASNRATSRLRPGAGRSIVVTAAAAAFLMTAAALVFS